MVNKHSIRGPQNQPFSKQHFRPQVQDVWFDAKFLENTQIPQLTLRCQTILSYGFLENITNGNPKSSFVLDLFQRSPSTCLTPVRGSWWRDRATSWTASAPFPSRGRRRNAAARKSGNYHVLLIIISVRELLIRKHK